MLAVLVGGGGIAIGVRRRGDSEPPESPPSTVEIDMRAAEIEAELQELFAEARLEAELGELRAGATT